MSDQPQLDHTISSEAWKHLLQAPEILDLSYLAAQASLDTLMDEARDKDAGHLDIIQDLIWQVPLLVQRIRELQGKAEAPRPRPVIDEDNWEPA